jgi:TRAP-type uncharacterized transport system fused permease subunit
MRTSWEAFKVALVGFTLPFIFVYRPQLLLLDPVTGELASAASVVEPLVVAVLGVLAFAAGLAGFLAAPLSPAMRGLAFAAAALLLAPGPEVVVIGIAVPVLDAIGAALLAVLVVANLRMARRGRTPAAAARRIAL